MSGEEAVQLVETIRPSVVLMDINMGAMDGLEATKIITTAHPETFVILVSTYTEADMPPAARVRGDGVRQQGRTVTTGRAASLGIWWRPGLARALGLTASD